MEPILLAIALMFVPALHAQITVLSQDSSAYGIPDVIPVRPSCPDGFKTQRYRAPRAGNMGSNAARILEDYGSPASWDDVDTAQPQDGDYRCVRLK